MTNKKVEARGTVEVDTYIVIARAIDEGLEMGWTRAHKHNRNPEWGSEWGIKDNLQHEIMLALDNVLKYGGGPTDD